MSGAGAPARARPPQGGGEGKNILAHDGSEARLQSARNASALEPVGSKPTESRRRTAARSTSRMGACERAKRASTESTRRRAGGLHPAGLQPLGVEHGWSSEGCRDRVQAALSAVARSLRPKLRNRCGTVRRGIGGNGGLPSERSERGSEGHRRESGAPERAKRARVCLPAHAYACACSAQARTGNSFVYRGFRWVCGVFLCVIAYRIY